MSLSILSRRLRSGKALSDSIDTATDPELFDVEIVDVKPEMMSAYRQVPSLGNTCAVKWLRPVALSKQTDITPVTHS